jgi:hypothetical protein
MACPVNHPFFHALVFFLGVLVVLSRYARAQDSVPVATFGSSFFNDAPSRGIASTTHMLGSACM